MAEQENSGTGNPIYPHGDMDLANLTYRKATQHDIEYLLWLRQETMTEHLTNSGIEMNEETHLQRVNYEFEGSQIILLDDKAIGLLKTKEYEGKIEIIQIQVEPQYQRHGYGRKIITSIIELANEKNIDVTLSVLKKNYAKELYLRLGFTIIEEDEDSFVMLRPKQTAI